MINPDTEPVGTFLIPELKDQWNNAKRKEERVYLFSEWIRQYGELLRQSLNGSSIEITPNSLLIQVTRELKKGKAISLAFSLLSYRPADHKKYSSGFGEWEISLRKKSGGSWHRTGRENSFARGEFEQLDILPPGLGIRLRYSFGPFPTVNYINPEGTITTETTPSFRVG